MALHVLNPDQLQLEFAPSAEVAQAAAAEGFSTAPLKLTSQQLLFTRTAVLTGDNSAAALTAKRQEILEYFHQTYSCYEKLFEVMASDEAFYLRPDALRHPLIFYYGHTAVLYINKLITAKILTQRVNESYESMLAVGVDEMSWDDLSQTSYNWPSVAQVKQYRDRVRVIVDELIRTMPLQLPIDWNSPWWIILLGIEHERIHLETSSVLIRQLPISQVREHDLWPACPHDAAAAIETNELLPVPARQVDLGKKHGHALYGWDNEYGDHSVHVPAFTASKYLCSNREFMKFVRAGGYENQSYWNDEGWRWKLYRKATHPVFWVAQADNTFRLRLLTKEVDMMWDWPVEVNNLEAKAFCNWKSQQIGKSLRMPTEEEWASLRLHVLEEEHDQHSWTSAPGNINLEHWASSTPIDAFPFRHGFYDVIGNVWQWTETPIDEFAGFKVHPVYDDFSAPTFDTRHNLIKGGSWISTGNEATFLARFAFRRHFFQHAGFRYIESNAPIYFRPDTVERDPKVAVAVEAHFGPDYLNVPNFSAALASLVGARTKALGKPTGRVMDMGCGAGRATFELARHFTYSLGLDFSTRFFRVAVDLKARGLVHCSLPEEGDRTVDVCRVISDVAPHINADVMDRTEFLQGDACNLDQRYKAFDVVVAANLLEHCYAPRNFLNEIHRRINYGGLLVIASTYAWDESVTPRAEWLGGTAGSESSAEIVKRLLVDSGQFVHLANESCELPMVLREQARKFSHTMSHVMFFERCQ